MNLSTLGRLALLVLAMMALSACSTAPGTTAARNSLHHDVLRTIERFNEEDPGIGQHFDTAYGYAVFPSVGKGGIGIGGAHGRGEVFEQGRMVGHCDLAQGTIGFQFGGQVYSEIIFFEQASALERFKSGQFAFAAQASAVAVTAGASADAEYEHGVAVFTLAKGGLMYEASIGGQKFRFEPVGRTELASAYDDSRPADSSPD